MKLKTVVPAAHLIIEELKVRFPGYSTNPVIQDHDHWADGVDESVRFICWEEGPYEWAMKVSNPDSRWHIEVDGIFLEPYNSFVLAVMPKDI